MQGDYLLHEDVTAPRRGAEEDVADVRGLIAGAGTSGRGRVDTTPRQAM